MKKSKGTLPNLIIIGAQKCGTTSLHYYLNLHPQVSMSREKELNFFIRERNWSKGVQWYTSHFTGEAKIHGESSPDYTNYPFCGGVPERIYSVVPEAKFIYILRDPIERIISHYVHRYAVGQENRPLSEALADLNNNLYVCRSQYYRQLEQYLSYFPKSQILIITLEELYAHRRQTLQKVFRFINVDESFSSRKFSIIQHNSVYKRRKTRLGMALSRMPGINLINRLPVGIRNKANRLLYFPFSRRVERPNLDERLRAALIDHLKDDINRLRECTGRDFAGWSV